jgi:histidinol dehydrogenase
MKNTRSPSLTIADLHHIARDQADLISAMTRGAAALFRDSKKFQRPNEILDNAEAVLDDLEAAHFEIERRLQAVIDRARRNMRRTPTGKKAARVRKADTSATFATHDNVIEFKPRRDDRKARPL